MNCLLHIGMEKTGTTTIQNFFADNREALRSAGFLYPTSLGRTNHYNLVVYARDDHTTDNQRKDVLHAFGGDLDGYRKHLTREFVREAKASNCGTLIISNEHLQSRLTNVAEKRRLKHLLDQVCTDYRVFVYLRRQDRVAVSRFGTRLLSGSSDYDTVVPDENSVPYYYDYRKLLQQFREVFGEESLVVNRFSPERFPSNDVVRHLFEQMGLNNFLGWELLKHPARRNESLCIEAQKQLAMINKVVPRFLGDSPNPARRLAKRTIRSEFTGQGKTICREEAKRIVERFSDINSWVTENFFNGDELFDDDFSEYPIVAENTIDVDRLARVGAIVYKRASEENRRLSASLKACQGFAEWRADNRAEAEMQWRQACEKDPDLREALLRVASGLKE